jgi:hypothetical protein
MATQLLNSDNDIIQRIHCKKTFKSKPKFATVNQNISSKFEVYSSDYDCNFKVFITYSSKMPQDFSLGLIYDDLLLYRCNGFHGTTQAGYFNVEHHAYPHAHQLTIDDINCGRGKKPSHIINLTGKYIDQRSAAVFFFEECGIINYNDYLKINLNQLSLF